MKILITPPLEQSGAVSNAVAKAQMSELDMRIGQRGKKRPSRLGTPERIAMSDAAEIIARIHCDATNPDLPCGCFRGTGACGMRNRYLKDAEDSISALSAAGLAIERDWFADAADKTLDVAHPHTPPCRAEDGRGEDHAIWLLNQVFTKQVTGRKANSWLCYAQGVLVERGIIDLEDARQCNHEASQAMIAEAGK